MKKRTAQENYSLFSKLLLDEKIYLDPSVRFSDICKWIGADEKALETIVSMELGMSGDGLIAKYREGEVSRLNSRYDIEISR